MAIEQKTTSSGVEAHRSFSQLLFKWYGRFAVGLVLFIGLMYLAEVLGLPREVIGYGFLILTIGLYAGIGIATRTGALDEYYVAGRRVPAFFNGMATGADWMSAASFISMAGTLYVLGYEGLSYIMGWTGGYVLLALLLAPYIRKFGQFTIPDFVGARYGGNRARIVGAICGIIVSFTYVTAQVTGVGLIMARFVNVPYEIGVVIGLSAVLLCSFMGGMKAVTWTQVAQYLILIIAYLIPVTFLAVKLTGIPLPQIAYGAAFSEITNLERTNGVAASSLYVDPFNTWTSAQFLALTLCLMLGTAGLPHILIRFYTVPSVRQARMSVGWALFFIFLLYFTAPAYATLTRWEVLKNVAGKPFNEVKNAPWVVAWEKVGGMLNVTDANNNGRADLAEIRFLSSDMVVLATPEISGLPYVIVALVAAGGLAAALSTADGLLIVISSALSHDIYYRTINPRASTSFRLKLGKSMVLVAAALSALLAFPRFAIIADTVAWAFSLAAASFFPILVLGIFWKRCNSAGAITGMVAGLATTIGYIVISRFGATLVGNNPAATVTADKPALVNLVGDTVQLTRVTSGTDIFYQLQVFGIFHTGAGLFGLIVCFTCAIVVSLLTPPPPIEVQEMVEACRRPVLPGEGDTDDGLTIGPAANAGGGERH
jgi:cation/acetate symporter